MINAPLLEYIRQATERGVSREEISAALSTQGWSISDIQEAYTALIPPAAKSVLAPNMTPAPIQAPTIYPRRKSKAPLFIISTIVILLLLGGSAFAYFTFLAPSLSPTDILKKSLPAYQNVRSFSFTTASAGSATSQYGSGVPSVVSTFTLNTDGTFDFHVRENPLLNININSTVAINASGSKGDLALGAHAILADKNFYLALKNFSISFNSTDPKAANVQFGIALANSLVNSLLNKWIIVPTTNSQSSLSASTTSTGSYVWTANDTVVLRAYVENLKQQTTLTQVGTETLNTIPTYHLKVSVPNTRPPVDLVRKLLLEKQTVLPQNMDAFDQHALDIATMISQKLDLDVWIGKSDFLVYKVHVAPITIAESTTKASVVTGLDMTLSNYNQPTTITAPQGAVTMQQLMQTIFGGMFSPKPQKNTSVRSLLSH